MISLDSQHVQHVIHPMLHLLVVQNPSSPSGIHLDLRLFTGSSKLVAIIMYQQA